MVTFGDLLKEAIVERLTRGQVFWISNEFWPEIFERANSHSHPGLVCSDRPTLAPGTSGRVKRRFRSAFKLNHPEALNGDRSTFLLGLRKYIDRGQLGRFIGSIHSDDLQRLQEILGQEK